MSNRLISALRQIGPKIALRGLLLIVLLIGAGWYIRQFDFEEILGRLNFTADGGTDWLHGPIGYFLLGALFTGFGGPRQVVSFFAAYFFGFAGGLVLALAATLGGCMLALLAASGFREAARRFIRGRLDVAVQLWARNTFVFTLILRLLPFTSNLVTNLAAGATGMPRGPFLAASAVGYLPQTFVFALMGSGVNVGSRAQIALSILLFGLSVLIGIWTWARYRKELKRGSDGDPEPEETAR